MKPLDDKNAASLNALLAEIEARAEKATPGPWISFESGSWGGQGFGVSVASDLKDSFVAESSTKHTANNAIFIAHSRTDVPRLIVALKQAVELIDTQLDWDFRVLHQKDLDGIQAILAGEK